MQIEVTSQVLEWLASEAGSAHPLECCGLLLGQDTRVTAIQPAANIHPAPATHFTIDPQTLINAHREARSGGPQIIGYYHSHPNGLAEPSPTDQDNAARDGRIWAIITDAGITCWRDDDKGFTPLPYSIIPS